MAVRWLAAAATLVSWAGLAHGQEVDLARLRQALEFPRIGTKWAFSYELLADGTLFTFHTTDKRGAIEAATRTLRSKSTGTAADAAGHFRIGCLWNLIEDQERARTAFAFAAVNYAALVARQPGEPDLWLRWGRCHLELEHHADAAAIAARGLERFPDHAGLLIFQADCLGASGRRADQEALLDRALAANPGDGRLWLARADAWTSRAMDTLSPGDKRARSWQEITAFLIAATPTGDTPPHPARACFARSLECLDRVMDLAEGHPEWSPALAVHAIPHHLFRAALAGLPRERLGPELQKALRRGVADLDRLVPDEPAVHLFIYQLCARPPGRKHPGHRRAPWRAGQPRDCLRRLEALTAAPQPERAAQAWGMLASRAVMEGHFRQAAGYQRRAVELAPDLPQAWECLVGLQTAAGLYPEAREVGRDLVRRFPSARSHFFLAKALDAGGDTEEAVRHLQAALDLDPDHFHANLAMAVVHLRRAPLNPILSPPEPGVDTPLTQAARCLERAGDALPAREAAGEDVQEDRAAHLAVGGVWHALSQNTPLARTCLADALELCPNHKPAARYLGLLGGRAAQKPTGESFGRLPWD